MNLHRRDFFRRVAQASGAALIGGTLGWPEGRPEILVNPSDVLPSPTHSGIKHIVVVTMENRSFDHFLGWFPNADGRQNNTYPTPGNGTLSTYPLAPNYQGCGHLNPDHSHAGGRIDYDDGAMDGWLLNPANDPFCIGFYQESDIPFLAALARHYTTLDHYFTSIMAPTFPNRLFMLAAQTDRLDDSLTLALLPTIFDSLSDAGVSAGYYFNNLPFLALWGFKYAPIAHPYLEFLFDAATGNLPAVSFVDPWFTILDLDLANDDEPHTDIRRGDAFLSATFRAVASGPAWNSTVFVITFDEGGGFFDHVVPPRAAAPNSVDTDLELGKALLGFRVPTIVASPWSLGNARNPRVIRNTFDHTSILKLIEWRWGLPPLTERDESSDTGNLADVLNFAHVDAKVPMLPRPLPPLPSPCVPSTLQGLNLQSTAKPAWSDLAKSPLLKGWNVKP